MCQQCTEDARRQDARAARKRRMLKPLTAEARAAFFVLKCQQMRLRKTFAADQARRDARLHHPLEHMSEDIAVAKALGAGA
jgi:hypothetical protein